MRLGLRAIQWQDGCEPWGWETLALYETRTLADAAWAEVKKLPTEGPTNYRYVALKTTEQVEVEGAWSGKTDEALAVDVLEEHPARG